MQRTTCDGKNKLQWLMRKCSNSGVICTPNEHLNNQISFPLTETASRYACVYISTWILTPKDDKGAGKYPLSYSIVGCVNWHISGD